MVQNKPSLAPEDEAITFELDKKNGFNWLSHYDISIKDLLSDILKKRNPSRQKRCFFIW